MIKQDKSRFQQTTAEQLLARVGEAVLQRLRQTLPDHHTDEEPLHFIIATDSGSRPVSRELHFVNTFEARYSYEQLPAEEQAELFSGLQSTARNTLLRAEPNNKLAERDVDAYVFDDQSAVEVISASYRRNDSFFLPAVRAITWQQPELLVGDRNVPTEINLYRLGYQEANRTTDTTFYRHYDPTMPLVGHGYADGQHHVTIFNVGKIPTLLTLAEGERVDLRQATIVPQQPAIVQEPAPVYQKNTAAVPTRYPPTLLVQTTHQFGVTLTDEDARRLLNEQKTNVVETATGETGRLYVLNRPESGPELAMKPVQPALIIRGSYLGHTFTEKDRQNLHKYGDMGRVVELTDRHSGQPFAGFIGVDKQTRTLVVLRAEQIRTKIERMSHLKGVPLSHQQKMQLIDGHAVRLDNMTSKAGTPFSAFVRVSAATQGLRFDPVPGGQYQKKAQAASPDNPLKTEPTVVDTRRATRSRQANPIA